MNDNINIITIEVFECIYAYFVFRSEMYIKSFNKKKYY